MDQISVRRENHRKRQAGFSLMGDSKYLKMNAGELENFNELFENVARLKAVKCRLKHERVLYDGKSDLPIAECLPEMGFQRIGLCSPEIRRERISCGHTMARYALENALSLLAENGVNMIWMFVRDNYCLYIFKLRRFDQAFGEGKKSRIEQNAVGVFFNYQTRMNVFCDFHPNLLEKR